MTNDRRMDALDEWPKCEAAQNGADLQVTPPTGHVIIVEAKVQVEAKIRAEATVIRAGAKVIPLNAEAAPPSLLIVSRQPRFSLLLACVASKGRAEEFLGDAETEYRKMIAKLGPRWTPWWYRVYVLKLVSRLLPGVIMRVLLLHKVLSLLGL